jgi:uncharacterized OB-fold protein
VNEGVELRRCTRCGAELFPAPLLCPRCGGARWRTVRAPRGIVEETTTVHQAVGVGQGRPRHLATVRLPGGGRLIAALDEALPPGTRVRLRELNGAVTARLDGS